MDCGNVALRNLAIKVGNHGLVFSVALYHPVRAYRHNFSRLCASSFKHTTTTTTTKKQADENGFVLDTKGNPFVYVKSCQASTSNLYSKSGISQNFQFATRKTLNMDFHFRAL